MSAENLSLLSDGRDSDIFPETGCLSIIVLGASGDLAKKKTFPALYHLFKQVLSLSLSLSRLSHTQESDAFMGSC